MNWGEAQAGACTHTRTHPTARPLTHPTPLHPPAHRLPARRPAARLTPARASAAAATPAATPPPSRRTLSLASAATALVTRVRTALATPPDAETAAALNAGIKDNLRGLRTLAVVAPLAVTTGGEHVFLLLTRSVASFIKLYLLFLFMRVLLSWFPAFNWERQPWLALRQLTDPYLNMFRGVIPPFFGMIDFTPLLGFFVLQWVQSLLEAATMDDDDMDF